MRLKERKTAVQVAPSILSADFGRLAEEVRDVEKIGIDFIHVDVMDGHFVPNITIGPAVVAGLKKYTDVPLDVHLMIEHPQRFMEEFLRAGSAVITVHSETFPDGAIVKTAEILRRRGVLFGVSLNPRTSLKRLERFLPFADLVLVMSVNPGFAGREFIPEVLPKISSLRKRFSGLIEVDGGINDKTAPPAVKAGADILVAGSYVFRAKNRRRAIESLRLCKP